MGNNALRNAHQQKQEERDVWHKIVVKVIKWKDTRKEDGKVVASKISFSEWRKYYAKTLEICVTTGKDETKKRLRELKKFIKENDGFE